MFTHETVFANDGRMHFDGAFNLSAGAAVLNITPVTGVTKTCTGQNIVVAKTGTGTYTATIKTSQAAQGPVFGVVEVLDAKASLIATTLATVLSARVASVTTTTAGDIVITIITAQTTGAAADTTAAITVSFDVVICIARMDQPL